MESREIKAEKSHYHIISSSHNPIIEMNNEMMRDETNWR